VEKQQLNNHTHTTEAHHEQQNGPHQVRALNPRRKEVFTILYESASMTGVGVVAVGAGAGIDDESAAAAVAEGSAEGQDDG
jgi:hypothetical protein